MDELMPRNSSGYDNIFLECGKKDIENGIIKRIDKSRPEEI
jgi:hypothetical protein